MIKIKPGIQKLAKEIKILFLFKVKIGSVSDTFDSFDIFV